jgi:lysophospholipase L1-like esterase
LGCPSEPAAPRLVLAPPPPPVRYGQLHNAEVLTRTFERIHAIESGQLGRLAILQFGASHTAAGVFADEVHDLLAQRLGDLGIGYVPAAPMVPEFVHASASVSERRALNIQRSGPWEFETAMKVRKPQPWSLAGTRLTGRDGATLTVELCQSCDENTLRISQANSFPKLHPHVLSDAGTPSFTMPTSRLHVFFLASAKMARLDVTVEGQRQSYPGTQAPRSGVKKLSFKLDAPPSRFQVSVHGPGKVSVLGFVQERSGSGVVYDVLGLSGASVGVALREEPEALAQQLKARNPSLLVFFFGTNESVQPNLSAEAYRQSYLTLLRRTRVGPAQPDCLLMSNTDRQVRTPNGWERAPSADIVEKTIQAVAFESGCAFWSSLSAMGGPGSMARWVERQPPFALPDRTHLTDLGYQTLAEAWVRDFWAAYQAWKGDTP